MIRYDESLHSSLTLYAELTTSGVFSGLFCRTCAVVGAKGDLGGLCYSKFHWIDKVIV